MKQFRSFAALFLALLLILCLPSANALAADRVYHGIDVSEWQGDIDFEAVKESGVDVVYIRAGEGSGYTDAYFESHYQGALAAGLKIGFYHYVTASDEAEARQQAEFFYSLIRGKKMDCRPAMDFEEFPGLDNREINAVGAAFMERLKNLLGFDPALYSDTYNTANLWDASFSVYPLWAAEYGVNAPQNTGSWAAWDGFQYSDQGNVPGITGDVDLDYFKDSILAPGNGTCGAPAAACTYTVRPGDTLWALSRRFHTTVQELASLNRIANPNLIFVGQVLILPDSCSVLVYRIVPGDTLSAIALRFGTTVQAIAQANHIANPNLIIAGHTLVIPQ